MYSVEKNLQHVTFLGMQMYMVDSGALCKFGLSITESTADTIRYDTRCYFNVRSKADISQLNLPHGTDN